VEWLKKISKALRVEETLIPVYVDITSSEEEFVTKISKEGRFVLAYELLTPKRL